MQGISPIFVLVQSRRLLIRSAIAASAAVHSIRWIGVKKGAGVSPDPGIESSVAPASGRTECLMATLPRLLKVMARVRNGRVENDSQPLQRGFVKFVNL